MNKKSMHDHNENGSKNMMWMMAICCLLPIVILLFVGNSNLGGKFSWPTLIFFAFIASCFWFIRRKNLDVRDQNKNEDSAQKHDNHKGGCCH